MKNRVSLFYRLFDKVDDALVLGAALDFHVVRGSLGVEKAPKIGFTCFIQGKKGSTSE